MQNLFVKLSSGKIFTKDYFFPAIDYSSGASLLEDAKPTEHIMKFLNGLHSIAAELDPILNRKQLLSNITEKLFEFMTESKCCLTCRSVLGD